jgi:3,4-dihydroxy 2-butanone 4-phosphate synthase/GTP cyclohydrolase II
MIEAAGEGVVVYLRQEGRGIGLINKLKAYSLQDGGLDTVEANERLGFGADLRNYGVGAQILSDLGIERLRLITNNPRKIAGLGGYGLRVEDRVPLVMDPGLHNAAYLQTKRLKLGHMMDGAGHGLTAVLAWQGGDQTTMTTVAREGFETLRNRAMERGLVMEREEHPRLLALLEQPRMALLLTAPTGRQLSAADLASTLGDLAAWPQTERVSLLLAPDAQRSNHPRVDLEPERRSLVDLEPGPSDQAARCPLVRLRTDAFIVWQ